MHFDETQKPRSWAQWLVGKFVPQEWGRKNEPQGLTSSSLFLGSCPARAHQPRIDADALVTQLARWHPLLTLPLFWEGRGRRWWCLLQDKRRPRLNPGKVGGFKSWFASPSTTSSSLNSLFKVLCNFPSRYLFAIDLSSEYLALDGVYHPC